jgi:hypothetical protein
MKNFTIIHILLFLLMMLIYQCSNSQDYLVLATGDTLTGVIKPILFGAEQKVQINTADKKKSIYSIFKIKSYRFKGDIYQPVRGEAGYSFMKLLIPGYLSLYGFQPLNQMSFDGLLLQKKDGSSLEVPNLGYKRQMTRFLEDCAAVTERIESGELGRKELELIVHEYNTCIEDRTKNLNKELMQRVNVTKKISAWDILEEKVIALNDLENKSDVIEMINEIKGKIKKNEKAPNFLVEGLKNSLAQTSLSQDLENALAELKP